MNPLTHRNSAAVDTGHPSPADTPMQIPPLASESGSPMGGEDSENRYQGDLFLPGWLKIELQPLPEQGPGG